MSDENSIPSRFKTFFCFQALQISSEAHLNCYSVGNKGANPGG